MIENATVQFTNGTTAEVEKVKFKDGGWIGVRANDGWIYYPPKHIARVVARDADE
jgi:hypothetical protein